ncbi:MAG: phosphopantothenoylcysteine decarboxylase / phosphopantothenate--cysteine ligase [bacterium P3]|nr:MAG: phosphopantothenoylcysteine decarboxylase / phosphopantothenate--cysteine ligase [bacterium P3]KWW42349.1 MAG: phosphopantothenoylcysteine decarboxylase / phosphopantothenate--cysteine ligase [bacterium F083]
MNVIVGISGGIAAYKVPALVRLLCDAGHAVRCVATSHALEFVTRTTLQTVSGQRVYCALFDTGNEYSTEHIALKDWCDAVIVAPATANIIGKMACGIGDDALSTLLLSVQDKRVFVCPAMNTAMWCNKAVQRNISLLQTAGVTLIGPDSGHLACGTTGAGRMAQPEAIADALEAHCSPVTDKLPLEGKKVLVTAGPTYERIDPVRYIGNFSSGKMGVAIADAIAAAGAEVELVAGPTHERSTSARITLHTVESARQMYELATRLFPGCDAAILAAAVADYRPESYIPEKLKRQDSEVLTLRLVRNPDILATLGGSKRDDQTLVGFALETNDEMRHAREKMERKNLDYIVLNSLRDDGAGFGVDTNKVTIIHRNGSTVATPLLSKREVARRIVDHCLITPQKTAP